MSAPDFNTQPDKWDTVSLDGRVLPGRASVDVDTSRNLRGRGGTGRNGRRQTDRGAHNAKVTIDLLLFRPEHFAQWLALSAWVARRNSTTQHALRRGADPVAFRANLNRVLRQQEARANFDTAFGTLQGLQFDTMANVQSAGDSTREGERRQQAGFAVRQATENVAQTRAALSAAQAAQRAPSTPTAPPVAPFRILHPHCEVWGITHVYVKATKAQAPDARNGWRITLECEEAVPPQRAGATVATPTAGGNGGARSGADPFASLTIAQSLSAP